MAQTRSVPPDPHRLPSRVRTAARRSGELELAAHQAPPRRLSSRESGRRFALTPLGVSAIGGLLPPGASVDLARSALFFDGARIAGPIVVLVVWAALGTVLALALGGRIMRPSDTEAAAAAGAAV